MNAKQLIIGLFLFWGFLTSSNLHGQSSGYVNRIIASNSGKFEFSPPYADFATVQSYNPQNGNVDVFNTIFTQSTQCVIVFEKMAYVAAQDSIIKFNLNTMQRVAAVKDSGLSQLAICKGRLVVSKQYPVSQHFVEVLDTATLGVVAQVTGISGDCGGIVLIQDTVYVAVNGGWMGTNGKLAVIDPATWSLVVEVDFGTDAVGIFNLYNYEGNLFAVSKSPYGVVGSGNITGYLPFNRTFTNFHLSHTLSAGAGIDGNLLFVGMDNGIGSFNLNTLAVEDPSVVNDPGSSSFIYITSAVVDSMDHRIYTNIGDYATPGHCLVTNLVGDSLTSYATGIATDAVAIDYRMYPVGIADGSQPKESATIYPNPVKDVLMVAWDGYAVETQLFISDITGRILFTKSVEATPTTPVAVPCHALQPGTYLLTIQTSKSKIVKVFIKE